MKDKLEPNMYVRTKWGYICKIININDFREPSMKYGVEANYLKDVMFIGDDDIQKASHNIIDLLEVGDYVNGYIVEEIKRGYDGKIWIDNGTRGHDEGGEYTIWKRNEDIKSIVTKEQFSQMEYKVGE